jgi:hypothetical protein
VISIWDDGYGISVPNEIQTTKGDISEVLKGFQKEELTNGIEIFKVRGWIMRVYVKRTNRLPKLLARSIFHV